MDKLEIQWLFLDPSNSWGFRENHHPEILRDTFRNSFPDLLNGNNTPCRNWKEHLNGLLTNYCRLSVDQHENEELLGTEDILGALVLTDIHSRNQQISSRRKLIWIYPLTAMAERSRNINILKLFFLKKEPSSQDKRMHQRKF